jgi:hypothetical protein
LSALLSLELVLQDFCFNLQVSKLVAQALRLNPEPFSFLLSDLDLLLHHDRPLDSNIILRFHVL